MMAPFLRALLAFVALVTAAKPPSTHYDVIIVGGGPAGLSAQSALCRVSRTSILFDDSRYRNQNTRHMHDVIGNDGTEPHLFRQKAREQIAKYETGRYKNATVIKSIFFQNLDGSRIFYVHDQHDNIYTARRVILATGIEDVLPSYLDEENVFGKGVYWCPWCDAFEHRGQPLGVLGNLSNVIGDVIELKNVNPDMVILADGSDTDEQREILTKKRPHWKAIIEQMDVRIINDKIKSIKRLEPDGGPEKLTPECRLKPGAQVPLYDLTGKPCTPYNDSAGPNKRHYDRFQVTFETRPPLERSAFMFSGLRKQRSDLPARLALQMADGDRVYVYPHTVNTTVPGIYAVGDMTNEGATNVPWAMYSGKKAGVNVHVSIAAEDALLAIKPSRLSRRGVSFDEAAIERRAMAEAGEHMETIWQDIENKRKK